MLPLIFPWNIYKMSNRIHCAPLDREASRKWILSVRSKRRSRESREVLDWFPFIPAYYRKQPSIPLLQKGEHQRASIYKGQGGHTPYHVSLLTVVSIISIEILGHGVNILPLRSLAMASILPLKIDAVAKDLKNKIDAMAKDLNSKMDATDGKDWRLLLSSRLTGLAS